MANPLVSELIERGRAIFREKFPSSTEDSPSEWLAWINEGLSQSHGALRYRLGGRVPPTEHPYWSQFFLQTTIALVSGTTDYALPSMAGSEFDFLHSVVEETNGKRLTPYLLEDELAIKRGTAIGVGSGYGKYTFISGNYIRLLVSPGSFGIPKEARNILFRYFKRMPHHLSIDERVALRPEFCVAPVNWGVVRAMDSKRADSRSMMGEYKAAVAQVPKP